MRYPEIDILRGIVIIGMIILHTLWTADYLHMIHYPDTLHNIAFIIQITFLMLVGICCYITFQKRKKNEYSWELHTVNRSLQLLSIGIIFTAITMMIDQSRMILFGMLSLIALGLSLSILTVRLKPGYNLLISGLIITLYPIIKTIPVTTTNYYTYIIGLTTKTNSFDYFPLIPYLAFIIFGVAIGQSLYTNNQRNFTIPKIIESENFKIITFLGHHSLLIYILHIPVIMSVLLLLKNFFAF